MFPDKPKRKRQPPPEQGIVSSLFGVPRLEFLSPLTLEECVYRIELKGRSAIRSPDKFEAMTWRISPGMVGFHMNRTIIEGDDWGKGVRWQQRRNVTRVAVEGRLNYWDDESTLVTCRAKLGIQAYVVPALLGLVTAATLIGIIAENGLTRETVAFFFIALVVLAMAFGWFWLNIAQEHRRLLMLVDDMLREPVLLSSARPQSKRHRG